MVASDFARMKENTEAPKMDPEMHGNKENMQTKYSYHPVLDDARRRESLWSWQKDWI